VLKSADGFAVFSRHGDIARVRLGEQGLYYLGVRHLSEWRLLIDEREPLLLNSTVQLDKTPLAVDQTTVALYRQGQLALPQDRLHLRRELAVHDCILSECLQIVNYHYAPLHLELQYSFEADFRDLFEVRGERREKRGTLHEAQLETDALSLGYQGLDEVARHTRIAFDRLPDTLSAERARFQRALEPGASWTLEASIACASSEPFFCGADHRRSVEAVDREVAEDRASRAEVFTDNEQFNDWLNRSAADLQMLCTETRHGFYPYGGVPWFSTPFGRHGLVTALQTL